MTKMLILTTVFMLILWMQSCDVGVEKSNSNPLQDVSKINLTACSTLDTFQFYREIMMQSYTYSEGQGMFGVQGIRLGTKISSEAARVSDATKKGVHLHLNVDNTLHEISNENNFPCPIPDGKHKLFAFIATPYYESIKKTDAIIAKEVEIRGGKLAKSHNLPQADIAYNAPRGEHNGDTVLLDFVLINTTIGENANSVRVTIDEGAVFNIRSWQAHYINGLVEGKHTVKLELLDATGKLIALPVSHDFVIITEPTKNNHH